ncbi:MAG: glycosyltransferase family 9 protein [Janthinobacterium lividum]
MEFCEAMRAHGDVAGDGATPRLPEGFSLPTLATLRRLAHERAVQGRAEEASSLFKTVLAFLAPGEALALINVEHACVLAHFALHDAALAAFDAALDARVPDPTRPTGDARLRGGAPVPRWRIAALAGKAMSLVAVMRGEEALALLNRCADLPRNEHDAGVLASWDLARTHVLLGLHRPLEALDAVRQVLRRAPRHTAALLAQATILLRLQQPMQAVGVLEHVFARDPDHPAALVLFGQALAALGEFAFAVDRFERALQVAPRYAPAYRYMASALCMQQMDDAALVCLRAARTLQPDWPLAWLDEAGIRLRRGELTRGFAAYEWRASARCAARQGGHFWNGDEAIEHRSLLVLAEQGLGDTLQFVRYLPHLAKLARDVVVEVQPPLLRLVAARAAQWGVRVIGQGDPRPDTDRFTLLMSLPHALRTRLDTIPAEIPYLGAPSPLPCPAAAAAPTLTPGSRPLRVGIVASGNAHFVDDAIRSMPLAALASVLGVAGVDVVLLQPAVREADRQWALTNAPGLRMPLAVGDFVDTAEHIASLDLVISVDTAVAHLAGALGKPVWIMLPYLADWRWMHARRDSPWYPSATLFRQAAPHDWAGVVEAARVELVGLVEARGSVRAPPPGLADLRPAG